MESIWGNDGYACFYKLYELLGDSEGHIFDLRKPGNKEYLSAEIRVTWEIVDVMLHKLSELGIIDADLLDDGIIWSQCFVDDLEFLYARRKVNKPVKPDLRQHKTESDELMHTETPLNGINNNNNPQSKVKYSKEPPLPPQDSSPEKPEPPPKPPKPKRVKVSVDYDLEIQKAVEAFSPNIRTAVQAFVAVVASLNKTQKISQARELSLLGELSGVSATTTPDIFRYAILEATDRKKGNTGYIKAIIERKQAEGDDCSSVMPTEGAPPRAAPKLHFYQNKDGTFTRVDPCGDERRVTKADMHAELQAAAPQLNEAQQFIGAIAGAM